MNPVIAKAIALFLLSSAPAAAADGYFSGWPQPFSVPGNTWLWGRASTESCTVPVTPGFATTITLPPDRSWHLLTQSYGGAISLLKELTQHECEFARARALGLPATDEEKAAAKVEKDKLDAQWAEDQKWAKEHHCTIYDLSNDSNERKEYGGGLCHLPSMFTTTGHLTETGDIKSAECFQ